MDIHTIYILEMGQMFFGIFGTGVAIIGMTKLYMEPMPNETEAMTNDWCRACMKYILYKPSFQEIPIDRTP